MWLCAGLSRTKFALLAGPRATGRATDSQYLFDSRLLGIHGQRYTAVQGKNMVNFTHLTGIGAAQKTSEVLVDFCPDGIIVKLEDLYLPSSRQALSV